jgi:hypothetical protein
MNNNRKILNVILSLFLSSVSLAQNDGFTNIDLNYLKPNWTSQNLSVRNFRNGLPIYEAKSIEEFDQIHRLKKKNTPAFMVFENEYGQSEFYYNFYAIMDTNLLAPFGFKIPEIDDFKNLWSNKSSPIEAGVGTRFNCSGYVDNTSGVDIEDNRTYLWTNELYKGDVEHGLAFLFNRDLGQVEAYNLPMYKQYGLSVRCIEDLLVTIKDSIFEYKKLLPKEYNQTINGIFNELNKIFNQDGDFIVSAKGSMDCSKTGVVSFNLNSVEHMLGKGNEDRIRSIINSSFSQFNTVPYYKGNILAAHSDFKLIFKQSINTSENWKTFDYSEVKSSTVDSVDKVNLDQAYQRGFKYRSQNESIEVSDFGNILINEKSTRIEKFEAPWISNSMWCLLPGLGIKRITKDAVQNYNVFNWKMLGKTFLVSSISLGVISISSKIYSYVNYNRYKYDMFGSAAATNYKKANISQKIFLSSLGGYGLLGLLDFGFTFGIGVKNKAIAKDLNSAIQAGEIIKLK